MNEQETKALRRHLKVTEKANLEIRDNLAIERTQFANERTFLAYMRTSMGLVLAGFSLVQFFREQVFIWVGVVIVPAGLLLAILGLQKYLTKRKHIAKHRSAYTPISHLHAQVASHEKSRAERFYRK